MGEWYKLYSGVYGSIFISYSIGKHEIRRIISATQMQRKKNTLHLRGEISLEVLRNLSKFFCGL